MRREMSRQESSPGDAREETARRSAEDYSRLDAGSTRLMLHLATALLILVAFCALAATSAELIAAGRAALDQRGGSKAAIRPGRTVAAGPIDSGAHDHRAPAGGRRPQKH